MRLRGKTVEACALTWGLPKLDKIRGTFLGVPIIIIYLGIYINIGVPLLLRATTMCAQTRECRVYILRRVSDAFRAYAPPQVPP